MRMIVLILKLMILNSIRVWVWDNLQKTICQQDHYEQVFLSVKKSKFTCNFYRLYTEGQ